MLKSIAYSLYKTYFYLCKKFNMIIDVEFAGGMKINSIVKGYTINTDQDVAAGGEGTAPDPFSVFLASLAACAGVFTNSFCKQRGIPVDDIKLNMEVIYNPEIRMISNVVIRIKVPADFPEKYEAALINAVGLCSVKRHLSEKVSFETLIIR